MTAETCIFCAIIDRAAPASFVHEDAVSVSFMDINPINHGHVLLIPKQHFVTLEDCDRTTARHLISTVQMLNIAVRNAVNCGGILNEIMNGEPAGQEIFHLHIHIVPRNTGDGFGWKFPVGYRTKAPSRSALDDIARRIRQQMSTDET